MHIQVAFSMNNELISEEKKREVCLIKGNVKISTGHTTDLDKDGAGILKLPLVAYCPQGNAYIIAK